MSFKLLLIVIAALCFAVAAFLGGFTPTGMALWGVAAWVLAQAVRE